MGGDFVLFVRLFVLFFVVVFQSLLSLLSSWQGFLLSSCCGQQTFASKKRRSSPPSSPLTPPSSIPQPTSPLLTSLSSISPPTSSTNIRCKTSDQPDSRRSEEKPASSGLLPAGSSGASRSPDPPVTRANSERDCAAAVPGEPTHRPENTQFITRCPTCDAPLPKGKVLLSSDLVGGSRKCVLLKDPRDSDPVQDSRKSDLARDSREPDPPQNPHKSDLVRNPTEKKLQWQSRTFQSVSDGTEPAEQLRQLVTVPDPRRPSSSRVLAVLSLAQPGQPDVRLPYSRDKWLQSVASVHYKPEHMKSGPVQDFSLPALSARRRTSVFEEGLLPQPASLAPVVKDKKRKIPCFLS